MSRCGGRYQCGCGRDYCWWSAFGLLWWLVAFEITEQMGHKRNNGLVNYLEQIDEEVVC